MVDFTDGTQSAEKALRIEGMVIDFLYWDQARADHIRPSRVCRRSPSRSGYVARSLALVAGRPRQRGHSFGNRASTGSAGYRRHDRSSATARRFGPVHGARLMKMALAHPEIRNGVQVTSVRADTSAVLAFFETIWRDTSLAGKDRATDPLSLVGALSCPR